MPCSEPSVAPWPKVRECTQRWKRARRQKKHSPQADLEAAQDTVADGDRGDPSPTATTVPTYSWPIVKPGFDLDAAVVDVQVGAADARGLDAHDRVGRVEQLGLGDVLDGDHAGRLEGDCAHRRSL